MSLDLARPAPTTIDLGVLPSELDGGLGWRAAIGLVVLATDQTMEHEFRALIDLPGVAFYELRVFNDAEIRPDTLRAIGPRIAPSVALILPGLKLDVVAFGCTSATMTLGEAAVFDEIHKSRPGVACTTPVTAALAAFRAFGAKSIGLLTPYAPEINASLIANFRARGIDVAAAATFDRRDDRDAARISVASIEAGIVRLAKAPGVETIFVSCTSLRVAEAAAKLERLAGVPVTSSEPRDGLALPAARRRCRPAARFGPVVRTAGLTPSPVHGRGPEGGASPTRFAPPSPAQREKRRRSHLPENDLSLNGEVSIGDNRGSRILMKPKPVASWQELHAAVSLEKALMNLTLSFALMASSRSSAGVVIVDMSDLELFG